MKANPDKFQAICVGKDWKYRYYMWWKCYFAGNKHWFYVEIWWPCRGFGKHASIQLAVLKRLGRFLNKQGKMIIYNSFIASNFSYCPLSWHFAVHQVPINLKKYKRELWDLLIMTFHPLLVNYLRKPILSHYMLEDWNWWLVKCIKLLMIVHQSIYKT